MVAEGGEGVLLRVAGADLPQEAHGVTDRLLLRGIQGARQEVLGRAILTLLRGGGGEAQQIYKCEYLVSICL